MLPGAQSQSGRTWESAGRGWAMPDVNACVSSQKALDLSPGPLAQVLVALPEPLKLSEPRFPHKGSLPAKSRTGERMRQQR